MDKQEAKNDHKKFYKIQGHHSRQNCRQNALMKLFMEAKSNKLKDNILYQYSKSMIISEKRNKNHQKEIFVFQY